MLYMDFQYGLNPILIQRIFIGFEAILEMKLSLLSVCVYRFLVFSNLDFGITMLFLVFFVYDDETYDTTFIKLL